MKNYYVLGLLDWLLFYERWNDNTLMTLIAHFTKLFHESFCYHASFPPLTSPGPIIFFGQNSFFRITIFTDSMNLFCIWVISSIDIWQISRGGSKTEFPVQIYWKIPSLISSNELGACRGSTEIKQNEKTSCYSSLEEFIPQRCW
jgi:hypothetical protein